MKKISTLLFFSITLLFSSASMAQSSDAWVGDWELQIKDTPMGTITGILTIELVDDNLVGNIEWTSGFQQGTNEKVEHFNDSDNELILGFKQRGSGDLFFPLTLRFKDDETLSGTWKELLAENTFYNVTAEKSVAQNSNPWDGQFNLDFKNIDDSETNFVATLNIEYVNGKLEGNIIYFYQDDTKEEVVIEHFNDSDTELILGFKVEGSDALFFPLTLRFENDGSISGSWEDEEESFTVVGFRIAAQTQISE
jgi:hypothetical protein